MSVTLAVLHPKWVNSRLVNDSQFMNMRDMLVTLLVVRFSKPLMVVSFLQPVNHALVLVGRALVKVLSKTTVVAVDWTVEAHLGESLLFFSTSSPDQTASTR